MKRKTALVITLFVISLCLVATTATVLAQPDYTIMTAKSADLGEYLADGQGKTLYYFTKDAPGISNCKGQCPILWPPFYTEKIMVPAGMDPTDFSMITREDGMKQTTFKGWPLYYFNKDMQAGELKGQNFNSVWFVINVN